MSSRVFPCTLVLLVIGAAVAAVDDKPSESDVVALREFQKAYALDEGEDFKWVPTPFIEQRLVWYRIRDAGQAKLIPRGPDTMTLSWKDDQFSTRSMTFGAAHDLAGVLYHAFDISASDVEAPKAVLDVRLPGDFVVRAGAAKEKLVSALAAAIRERRTANLKMEFREVDRKVYVAAGRYKYSPLLPGSTTVDLFGDAATDPQASGNGSSDLKGLCRHAGQWIERPIVMGEIEDAPKSVSWREMRPLHSTAETEKANRDPAAVVANLEKQTGLRISEEMRKVKILFIEKVE